jgi:hypothetical protein
MPDRRSRQLRHLRSGEMTLVATLEEVSGGTEVTLVFKNLLPGLRAEDN